MDDRTAERRKGLPETRSFGSRLYSLVLESDTTPTKFTLATFALLQGLAFPFNTSCPYTACRFLEDAMPYEFWSALFLSYAALKAWRIFDGRSRPMIARVINGYGAALFGAFASALLVARWPFWILAVPYFVFAAAAVWVFARTAINADRGFRGD
jgi:hypothetical protein